MAKIEQAKMVGAKVAEAAKAAGVESVVFDRNGYLYHGRVKSLADAAREGGLNSDFEMRDNNNRRRNDRDNQPESDIKDRLVTINRSTKTTKGGHTFTFTGIVVVGDEKGKVGHGSGRSREVVTAIQKGIEDAKKNMVEVPVINGTVPHAQEAVYAGARVLVKPATPGTGVIAGGAMRAVLESAGIKDVLAKSLGSSNTQNVVKATFKALTMMRSASDVADLRGISVHRVFNG